MEQYEEIRNHAKKRMKQRSSKSKRENKLALERGLSYEAFTGSFRRYLDKLRFKSDGITKSVIVYNNSIFLYNPQGKLITVLKVPSKYLKYLTKD